MVLHNFSPPPPWESAPAHDGTTSRNTGRDNRGREMPRDRSLRPDEPMGRDTSLTREGSSRRLDGVLARLADERGSATAEYAVATMAIVAHLWRVDQITPVRGACRDSSATCPSPQLGWIHAEYARKASCTCVGDGGLRGHR